MTSKVEEKMRGPSVSNYYVHLIGGGKARKHDVEPNIIEQTRFACLKTIECSEGHRGHPGM